METANAAPDLRYPIGRFSWPAEVAAADRAQYIDEIAALPGNLRHALGGLADDQLDTPYRPGGWTVRQLVHHIADSHLNSYVRFKLALTEKEPTIKPYDEAAWANLPEAKSAPTEISLGLIDNLHERWVLMLQQMTDNEFARAFHHPERGIMRLDATLALYAWHGRHHVAHITALRERLAW